MNEPFKTHLVGRFRVDLPAAFKALPQDSSVAGVEVTEIPLPAGFEAQWAMRVGQIRTEKKSGKRNRILETKELLPGLRVVDYYEEFEKPTASVAYRNLEALIDGGRIGLAAKLTWTEDRTPLPHSFLTPEQEAAETRKMEACFYDVVGGYRFFPVDSAPAVNDTWFYLPGSAIAVPVRRPTGLPADDFVEAGFEDPKRRMHWSLRAYVERPDDEERSGFVAGMIEAIFRWQLDATVLRSGKRLVGKIEGEEVLMLDRHRNSLDYSWLSRARKHPAGYALNLKIEMSARPADEPSVTAIWDHVLDSFANVSAR